MGLTMDIQHLLSSSESVNTVPSSNLCQDCRHIFNHWDEVLEDDYNARFPHCQNIFGLIESAARGCYLCNQFLRNLEIRGIAKTLRGLTIDILNSAGTGYNGYIVVNSFERIISRGRDHHKDCWLLELRFRPPDALFDDDDDDDEQSDEEDDLQVDETDQDADEDMETSDPVPTGDDLDDWPKDGGVFSSWPHEISRDMYSCRAVLVPSSISRMHDFRTSRLSPDSRAALWQARSWLETCSQSHPQCLLKQSSLPTRLLCLDGSRVRVCTSKSLDSQEPPAYATLSHCWGSLKILQLTKENHPLLVQGIPHAALCRTFQDAIQITLALGLRYIWIDSLCIVQNDPKDWAREATRMSDVYSGGAVNIAASSASDGSVGCFFNRDSSHVWQHTVAARVNGQNRIYDCIEDGISDACIFETPLARRAWVMQERLLAPRTLHFSSTQMFWECNTLNACEVFPEQYPATLSYVKLYSICDLTYQRDKLVAISGIAREIVKRDPQAKYVAGLWDNEIENQLCWKVRAPAEKTLQAPSWSWAAVNGTVNLATVSQFENFVRVLEVDLQGHEPFGEILTATLTIACQEIFHISNMSALLPLRWSTSLTISWDYAIESARTFLLPVQKGVSLGSEYISGLLLQETKKCQGEYRRVGHFEQLAAAWERLPEHLLRVTTSNVRGRDPWHLGNYADLSPDSKIILLV
ncbi:HET-domain-containing protein [Mollisia scopiformis]|uniref:HET-domain-containing protein n=1 Tax=Mollisia scopiformis TaxID=149040 RepID=A0A194XTC7_MOLSC|nr:HET-domain-containing protein [Mollisia scopiformis]KUJ23570.1 HET-domain-containing protein [Mollisia scopiformis]